MKRLVPRLLLAPAVVSLLAWMLVPLAMTVYFSLVHYNLLMPGRHLFTGLENYRYFMSDPAFGTSLVNTLELLGSVIAITVVLGIALAQLVHEPFPGRPVVRLMLIAPFFVMPAASALLWKYMMMNPIYGVLAQISLALGFKPVDWLTELPLLSIIIIVSWEWLPFAFLIFMTALQSLDQEQMEAARMDGANALQRFWYLTLPHLKRSISMVVMIELIFLISVFAEIFTTTGGGPGNASSNLAYLIFKQALVNFDVGMASAGALLAVVLANVVALFAIRAIGKNLD